MVAQLGERLLCTQDVQGSSPCHSIGEIIMQEFIYYEAKGVIYQRANGWGGRFKMFGITVELDAEFVGPETTEQAMQRLVDILAELYE